MAGKPLVGKVALTKNERQSRWRAKKRRDLIIRGDRAGLKTPKARPEDNEFWPTPPCLRAALTHYVVPNLPAGRIIWECAAGDGTLGDAIAATGRQVFMSDIDPQRRGILRHDVYDPPPPETVGSIAVTNLPWSEERLDPFIARMLGLLDEGHLRGVVLLLRADHVGGAQGRAPVFKRAAHLVTCCWRPIWIPGTKGNGRWWCLWVTWLADWQGPTNIRFLDPAELRGAGVWPASPPRARRRNMPTEATEKVRRSDDQRP
jgi:hypothetical protein